MWLVVVVAFVMMMAVVGVALLMGLLLSSLHRPIAAREVAESAIKPDANAPHIYGRTSTL